MGGCRGIVPLPLTPYEWLVLKSIYAKVPKPGSVQSSSSCASTRKRDRDKVVSSFSKLDGIESMMFDPGGAVRPECSYQGGEWSLDELGMISPPQSPFGGFRGNINEKMLLLVMMLVSRVAATFLVPPVRPPMGGCRGPFHRPPHPLPNGCLCDALRVQLAKPGSVQSALNCASAEFKVRVLSGGCAPRFSSRSTP